MFELWVDSKKLLGNMDLVTAVASFLHICFVFDLSYPKVIDKILLFITTFFLQINQESETLGDILQRRVAKYGDDSGKNILSVKSVLAKTHYRLAQLFCKCDRKGS